MIAVKTDPVAIQTKVSEDEFPNLTEPKKQIQCKATMTPMTIYCQMYFAGMVRRDFPKRIKKNKLTEVNKTLHQTVEIAGKEINWSFPKIAVKPKNKTATWSWIYAF